MSLYSKLRGTIETIFQIGLNGPQWKANGAVIEARNALDTLFAIGRGATPVAANDWATKAYVDGAAGGHAWLYDQGVPAAVVLPELAQLRAIAGGGSIVRTRSQAAAVGSNAHGGDWSAFLGQDDGTAVGTAPRSFWWGEETGVGSVENPPVNYYGYGLLKHLPGGVIGLALGGGSNNVGAGVAGVELSAFSLFNIATEGIGSTIQFFPTNGAFRSGYALFPDSSKPVVQSVLALYDADLVTSAASGLIRLPNANSAAGTQVLVAQRNQTNTADHVFLQAFVDEPIFGDLAGNYRFWSFNGVKFEQQDITGAGWTFDGPGGKTLQIQGDPHFTVTRGVQLADCSQTQLYKFNSTSTAANQNIGQIVLQDASVTQLIVQLVAFDTVAGDFASFTITLTYSKLAGVIHAPTAAATVVDTGHSAAAVAIAPALVVASLPGPNDAIQVQVTPWSANLTHWYMFPTQVINGKA